MYLLIITLDNYIYNTKKNILTVDIRSKAKLIVKLLQGKKKIEKSTTGQSSNAELRYLT